MPQTSFVTILSGTESGPTGIVVPPDHLAALGSSKRPSVLVTVNGYAYPSTVGVMGGVAMIPFAAEHRKATGIMAGDPIEVTLTLETGPRLVELPMALVQALQSTGLRPAFDTATPSRRKEWVRLVTDAKTEDTRARRLAKVVAEVAALAGRGE
jgi:hypothetical protein